MEVTCRKPGSEQLDMEELQEIVTAIEPMLRDITFERTLLVVLLFLSIRTGSLAKRALRESEAINQRFTDYLHQDAILRK